MVPKGLLIAGILASTIIGGVVAYEYSARSTATGQVLPFYTVDWGVGHGGNPNPTYLVVNNQSSLSEAWARAWSCVNSCPAPEVNFTEWTVIAAFQGAVESGGVFINVTQVSMSGSDLHVQLQLTVPDFYKCGATTAESYPFHIVRIPKTEAPATFTVQTVKRCH